ncbi:hypothetical protein ACFWNN_04570 [Lentzea sp. NPDC058450]|uniref:hypothetical protein n=1 Tax=Lentzea sp. NPDC058450 TaxID=3346505 RepID=UPI00364DB2F4
MSGINWEAYSHAELHHMLWQDADVADVSTVAEDWTRHRAALTAHAEVLREQRTALLDGWTGRAAEEAAARLATLAERVEKISELAGAGQKAAQDSADALAAARAAMPPPPDPASTVPAFAAPFTQPPAPTGAPVGPPPGSPSVPGVVALPSAPAGWATPGRVEPVGTPSVSAVPGGAGPFASPDGPALFGLPDVTALSATPGGAAPFALPSAPAPFALPSAPAPLALPAMPAGATSGFYFYFGAASADQQKAQAVRAMQTYESSLNGSGRLIDDARATAPQAAASPRASGPAPGNAGVTPVRTPSSGGVPWQRLLSGATGGAVPGAGPVMSAGQQVVPGMRAGVMAVPHGGIAATGTVGGEAKAAPGNAMGGPAGGAARKDEEQRHENQMPTLDHDLFAVTERVSPAVIGEEL